MTQNSADLTKFGFTLPSSDRVNKEEHDIIWKRRESFLTVVLLICFNLGFPIFVYYNFELTATTVLIWLFSQLMVNSLIMLYNQNYNLNTARNTARYKSWDFLCNSAMLYLQQMLGIQSITQVQILDANRLPVDTLIEGKAYIISLQNSELPFIFKSRSIQSDALNTFTIFTDKKEAVYVYDSFLRIWYMGSYL